MPQDGPAGQPGITVDGAQAAKRGDPRAGGGAARSMRAPAGSPMLGAGPKQSKSVHQLRPRPSAQGLSSALFSKSMRGRHTRGMTGSSRGAHWSAAQAGGERPPLGWPDVIARIIMRLRRERSLLQDSRAVARAIGRHLQRVRLGMSVQYKVAEDGTAGVLGIRSRATLDGLYDKLVESLEDRAVLALQRLWMPIVWLHHRRKRRIISVQTLKERKSERDRAEAARAILLQTEVFRDFPASSLDELARSVIPDVMNAGDVVLHQGEPTGKAMTLLITGDTSIFQRQPGASKGAGTLLGAASAPRLFGEFSLLCEEPCLATVVAVARVELGYLRQQDFLNALWKLPPMLRAAVNDVALAKRKSNLVNTFQASEEQLRQTPLFRDLPPPQLRMVLSKLRPRVTPPGAVICRQGDKSNEMYFVARGKIALKVATPTGEEMLVATLPGGTCFGEWGLLFGERRTATAVSMVVCELWVLSGADLAEVANSAAVREPLRESVNAQRLRSLQEMRSQKKFKATLQDYVMAIPLLRRVLTRSLAAQLADLFAPRVFSAGDIICTRSEMCDRIIIATRGKATVQDGGPERRHLALGEAVGYTCLLEHRWIHPIVAVNCVDIWEIRRGALTRFLRQHGLYGEVLRMSILILQPYIESRFLPSATVRRKRKARAEDDGDSRRMGAPSDRGGGKGKEEKEKEGAGKVAAAPGPSLPPQAQRTVAVQHLLSRLKSSLSVMQMMRRFINGLREKQIAFDREREKRRYRSIKLHATLTQPIGHLRASKYSRDKRPIVTGTLPADFTGQVRKLGRSLSMTQLKTPDVHPVRNERTKVFSVAKDADAKRSSNMARTMGRLRATAAAQGYGPMELLALNSPAPDVAVAERRAERSLRKTRIKRFVYANTAGLCRTPAMPPGYVDCMRLIKEVMHQNAAQHASMSVHWLKGVMEDLWDELYYVRCRMQAVRVGAATKGIDARDEGALVTTVFSSKRALAAKAAARPSPKGGSAGDTPTFGTFAMPDIVVVSESIESPSSCRRAQRRPSLPAEPEVLDTKDSCGSLRVHSSPGSPKGSGSPKASSSLSQPSQRHRNSDPSEHRTLTTGVVMTCDDVLVELPSPASFPDGKPRKLASTLPAYIASPTNAERQSLGNERSPRSSRGAAARQDEEERSSLTDSTREATEASARPERRSTSACRRSTSAGRRVGSFVARLQDRDIPPLPRVRGSVIAEIPSLPAPAAVPKGDVNVPWQGSTSQWDDLLMAGQLNRIGCARRLQLLRIAAHNPAAPFLPKSPPPPLVPAEPHPQQRVPQQPTSPPCSSDAQPNEPALQEQQQSAAPRPRSAIPPEGGVFNWVAKQQVLGEAAREVLAALPADQQCPAGGSWGRSAGLPQSPDGARSVSSECFVSYCRNVARASLDGYSGGVRVPRRPASADPRGGQRGHAPPGRCPRRPVSVVARPASSRMVDAPFAAYSSADHRWRWRQLQPGRAQRPPAQAETTLHLAAARRPRSTVPVRTERALQALHWSNICVPPTPPEGRSNSATPCPRRNYTL
eukprot:TRINITY_DN127_c0_g3_i1.p1 TRINITY_DN127_c0_g3~~TRINITY_DN127_c0_g3_i1.p1  ORF type:complete len:1560 (+),score=336.76 TRINITY_DN127_c0_g3_i1:80-4681(+)